ncbi:MAG TPA: NADH-quinone oxidoreductase subunit F, partial [Tissierellales bacterium]|nr:NADH-quinone oxidoreductase subunit F [Tissierellales bacterium]
MNRIEDYKSLLEMQKELVHVMDIRKAKSGDTEYKELLICGGTGCMSSQSKKLLENLNSEIEKNGLSDKVRASITGCFGFCEKGP